MKGSFKVKQLLPNKPYYISGRDYDSRLGGDFWLLIHPFPIDDENAFYYVRSCADGKIEIEGEGFIVTTAELLRRCKASARSCYAGKHIWYYWLNEEGGTICKEAL